MTSKSLLRLFTNAPNQNETTGQCGELSEALNSFSIIRPFKKKKSGNATARESVRLRAVACPLFFCLLEKKKRCGLEEDVCVCAVDLAIKERKKRATYTNFELFDHLLHVFFFFFLGGFFKLFSPQNFKF